MPLIELVAPAKINLGLAVESRRSDGFHNLVSVFQTVSWADRLSFYHADDVTFTCDRAELSTGPDNLVMRAASLLRERFALREGADIHLEKHIPWGAGLGGGSSDAAAALRGLAQLWNIEASDATWMSLAGELGSDVPFFVHGGTSVVTGRGEHVEPLRGDEPMTVVVAVPPVKVSTPWAFGALAERYAGAYPDATAYRNLVDRLAGGTISLIDFCRELDGWNTFQTIVEKHEPAIREVREHLASAGAVCALMSGSGSAVFGVFERPEDARRAAGSVGKGVVARTVTTA